MALALALASKRSDLGLGLDLKDHLTLTLALYMSFSSPSLITDQLQVIISFLHKQDIKCREGDEGSKKRVAACNFRGAATPRILAIFTIIVQLLSK